MPAPCSGICGGRRKIARPAKCGGRSANNRVSGILLYIGLCDGFILLFTPLCQGSASIWLRLMTDTSKTSEAVGALCHFIPLFMSLPYAASLYHVYVNHFMPQLPILMNVSGCYFMLSYAASFICEECFAFCLILLSAKVCLIHVPDNSQ